MSKKTDYFSLVKTRLFFLLIIFSFAGPLILATLMYKYSDIVSIAPPKSYGNLIEPVITISEKEDFNNILENKKWTFMYVYEDKTCDLLCEATLYMMQQVRESVGRERQRISNLVIVNRDFKNEDNINIQCYIFSKNYKKTKNMIYNLKVMIVTKEMDDHFNEAFR